MQLIGVHLIRMANWLLLRLIIFIRESRKKNIIKGGSER